MKNIIHKGNYEQYAMDYIENKLSADLKNDFELFLEQNPEIKQEIDEIKFLEIEQEPNVVLQDKTSLKKSPIEGITYTEYLLIGKIENQLSKNESKELDKLVNNNSKVAQDFFSFQKTILPPTEKIVYPFKNSLKKSNIVKLYTKRIMQVAAVFAFLFTFFYFYNNRKTNSYILSAINSNILIDTNNIPVVENSYEIVVKQTTIVQKNNTTIVYDTSIAIEQTNIVVYTEETVEPRTNFILSTIPQNELIIEDQRNSFMENKGRAARQLPELKPTTVLNFVLEGLYWVTESDKYIQVDKERNSNRYAVQVNKTKYWLVVK